MRKYILFFFFLFSIGLFSQSNSVDTIVITTTKLDELVDSKFSYLITTDKTITPKKLINSKRLQKNYMNCFTNSTIIDEKNQFKELWTLANVINKTKDTLDLVFFCSNIPKLDAFLISKQDTVYKKLGYVQASEDRFFNEIGNSFNFKMLPNEQKKIILHQTIVNPKVHIISKFTIITKDNLNERILNLYREYHFIRMLFAILLGGIFFMFLYNALLFIKTRSTTYLFYSLYLFCNFIYILIIIDKNQNYFLGNLMLYSELLKEISYILSFVFYGYFIQPLIDVKKSVKKIVGSYSSVSVIYFIFLIIEFNRNGFDFSYFDNKIIFIFKLISYSYIGYILFQLSKKLNKVYIRFIFTGSIILISSLVLQPIFIAYSDYLFSHFFFRMFVRTNFTILLGTILEVSFFTYALYIRSSQVVKEKMRLENLSQIKSRFFANISHEFRTPLTLIKSPVQSLQNEISDVNQKNKLNLIDANSTRMLQLVDQLLELSKIDSGNLKLILKDGNISSFLTTIIEPFQFQSKEKGIYFTSTIQKTTKNSAFDKDVIEKIVTNLVSNAFKYSPQNEQITFTSSVENSMLKLVVSNTGSDVKKEDLPQLFERFYQKNETQQGVGIGLALVKELVDLYKGTITTSVEKGELSFVVNLPLALANENAVVIPSKETTSSIENSTDSETELPILLIVDDNADIRSVVKDIFKNDYQILEAQDGEEALKLAQNQIPDCIISDVMMPKMDGFEFTKQIKNNELTSFIPVILLTAKTSDEAHLEGLKSTADAFLTKPFNNEIVKATVQQLIAERKKLHERYSQELVLKPVDIVINSAEEKFIEHLQTILDKNLSNSEYTAEDFASEIGMSRMQLHRKLKSLLGVSATEFLRNERLKVGAELLKQGNGNISEIAYSVGFSDVSYFSKCFKEMYHCTPTEYMEK
jgi:signal transduction histidine kinase/DNA-binding response OmpR family regulator